MPSPETSRQNLQKAKANWRAPLPWRSAQETRLIKALAWRWYKMKEPTAAVRVQFVAKPSPIVERPPCAPLVELKYSRMLLEEENRKIIAGPTLITCCREFDRVLAGVEFQRGRRIPYERAHQLRQL